jgi:hypothetical protein
VCMIVVSEVVDGAGEGVFGCSKHTVEHRRVCSQKLLRRQGFSSLTVEGRMRRDD